MTEKTVRKLEHSEFAALSAELIENSGGLRFRAHGRSMLPTIHSGDTLTLEKTDPDKLTIGDVVLIQNASNSLLAHRIIERNDQNENRWTTCGDALCMHDSPIKADQLLGNVTSVEHNRKVRSLSPAKGRLMALCSRHSSTLAGRAIKKVLRLIGEREASRRGAESAEVRRI